MLISLNWILDYVDLSGLDKIGLIHQFSLSTAEVENEIVYKGSDISGIVIAEIRAIEKHPESSELHLLKVDCGEKELVDVVCGAPNVRIGMKTAFAKIGARLGKKTITPRLVAGYVSNGMCCSEKELGISDENLGIMDIEENVANGTDLKSIYEIDDVVFEVDNKSLTNRPDLWGHYGIAREFATLSGRPLKTLELANLSEYDYLPKFDIQIDTPLCQRYSCLSLENIQQRVSPVNMRIRLFYCGMRGINLLTDLTNYIMLELGQPMHAFDGGKVEKICVKKFRDAFQFQTLDGIKRGIDENTVMICNGDIPIAVAGIMGGKESEITNDTTRVILEAATFDATAIRKSTVRLSHRTDASVRYEKSLDPEMTVLAIARFVKILLTIDKHAEVSSSFTDEYIFHYPKIQLEFNKAFVDRYTGIEISNDVIKNTLLALGFRVLANKNEFKVEVPSWRATKDITDKVDIIEEITRIYGYDNFSIHTTAAPLYPVRMATEKKIEEKIKDILVQKFALHELHSYIWCYADEYKKIGIEVEDNVKLLNSVNPNIETIRKSIIPTQFCQVKYNVNYATNFGVFEIGRVIDGLDKDNLCKERKKLAITLFSKTKPLEQVYIELRDILAFIVDDVCHRKLQFRKERSIHSYQHPKNLHTIYCDEKKIGEIGVVHPSVSKRIDKKAAIVYAEMDIEIVANIKNIGISYEEPTKYPSVEIDLSFITERFDVIDAAIKHVGSELLKKVIVTDVYTDENGKSITVRLVFSHNDRTLTREEVMGIVDSIVEKLKLSGVILKQAKYK